MSLTSDEVLDLYKIELSRNKPPKEAFQALRTEVHAALQSKSPPPSKTKDEDPDDHWMRQKSYGKALWKEADFLIKQANISEEGAV